MVSRPEAEGESMDAELAVAPPGCSHLGSFKVDNWKQNLRAIYQCFVWSGTAEARKRKAREGKQEELVQQVRKRLEEELMANLLEHVEEEEVSPDGEALHGQGLHRG
ncbi:hypothetical protein P7K49_010352 [Saguinus oedipus]|uniref:Uncharacterized protein n=1 Tax=Saguinus oedipus TaxID=9490 RepID=A0ABQ9VMK0_SAGOE|nr:hypothetical protein P7K49_010352 [Saguinus oedipus]